MSLAVATVSRARLIRRRPAADLCAELWHVPIEVFHPRLEVLLVRLELVHALQIVIARQQAANTDTTHRDEDQGCLDSHELSNTQMNTYEPNL